MPVAAVAFIALISGARCAASPSPVVQAPSSVSPIVIAPVSRAAASPDERGGGESPNACAGPWTLDRAAGAGGKVVVVCSNDVRREIFDGSSPIARALAPGLEPARARVCSCASRMKAPPFVDLVFTAKPDEGKVTVQASDGDEADLDPELGPPFVACIGTVTASFVPVPSNACPGSTKASFVYPTRIELGP